METRGIVIAFALACATACGGAAKTADAPVAPASPIVSPPAPILPAWRWASPWPSGEPLYAIWAAESGAPIVAVGEGGTVLTSDDGVSFVARAPVTKLALRSVRGAPSGEAIFAAGDQGIVLRSTDRGMTWSVVHAAEDDARPGSSLAVDDAGRVVATATLRSEDGGESWTPAERTSPDATDPKSWHDGLGTIAVDGTRVVRSVDELRDIIEVKTSVLTAITGARSALYVVADDGSIRRSDDGGTTWSLANALGTQPLVAVALAANGFAWAAGGAWDEGVVLASQDRGATWVVTPGKHEAVEAIWGAPDGGVFIVESGRLLRSSDRCVEWKRVADTPAHLTTVWGDGRGGVWTLGSEGGARSLDGGSTWAPMKVDSRGVRQLWLDERGVLWAVGAYGFVARSGDRGETWKTIRAASWSHDSMAIAGSGNAVVVAENDGWIYRSVDAGETFDKAKPTAKQVRWVAARTLGRSIELVADSGTTATSDDGGATWKEDALGPHARFTALAGDGTGAWLAAGDRGGLALYGTVVPRAPRALGAVMSSASPFAPIAEAAAKRRELDAKNVEALTARFDTLIGPALRLRAKDGWSDVQLGATVGALARTYRIGKHDCDGVEARFCPWRVFSAVLEPKTHTDAAKEIRAQIVDGMLYGVALELPTLPVWTNDDERRVWARAFQKAAIASLGPPDRIDGPSSDGIATTLYWANAVLSISTGSFHGDLRPHLAIWGGPAYARVEAVAKAAEAAQKREDDAREAAKRRRLCTCKHLSVQKTYPMPSGRVVRSIDQQQMERISAIDPKTCSVTLARRDPYHLNQETTRTASCADFDEPDPTRVRWESVQ